ncbi:hypothetical protein ABEB36_013771 [Hypothenemus hampei]|uniref:Uncharacterized protein n=1 Tax=Hypothenemus hampei TaxID=57062 RepID=A0ABD1E5E8_HYPHA
MKQIVYSTPINTIEELRGRVENGARIIRNDRETLLRMEENFQHCIQLWALHAFALCLLQPLDKCCFGPLKLKWNKMLAEWQRTNQRKLTKSEFADMICVLWNEGITETIIKKSFESTGIFPCCREKYPKDRLNELKLLKYNEGTKNIYPRDIYDLGREDGDDVNEDIEVQNIGQELDDVPTTSSMSTSFENIFLQKINKTKAPVKQRRKIDATCAVLTKLAQQRKKTNSKNTKMTVVFSSSESKDERIIYKDESDKENLTVERFIGEENLDGSFDVININDINVGDYILVKFCTKKKLLHYVALVENIEQDEYDVSYLRRKGDKFIFPSIAEKYSVPKEDVIMKLSAPTFHGGTARISQQLVFAIEFQKFNLN